MNEWSFVILVVKIIFIALIIFMCCSRRRKNKQPQMVVVQASVQQSCPSSQFAFQCCNLPQLLNTRKNVLVNLNIHFNLKF